MTWYMAFENLGCLKRRPGETFDKNRQNADELPVRIHRLTDHFLTNLPYPFTSHRFGKNRLFISKLGLTSSGNNGIPGIGQGLRWRPDGHEIE